MDEPEVKTDESLAKTRSRRVKTDKKGRSAALERLRQSKTGDKQKYEFIEDNVYDEVDEKEYSRIVRDRQDDDWIVDDDGSGYVEDGREIFDEDMNDAPQEDKKGREKEKSKNVNIRAPNSKPKSIKTMFAAAAVKPKKKVEKDMDLSADNLLGDIMAELHQDPSSALMPPPVKLKKKTPAKPAYNPFAAKPVERKPMSVKPIAQPSILNRPKVSSSAANDRPLKVTKPMKRPPPVKATAEKGQENDMDSTTIEEFVSQEVSHHASQEIDEDLGTQNGIDVSDIDFDDNFGEDEVTERADAEEEMEEETSAETDVASEGLTTSWETVKGDAPDVPSDVQVDSSKLPLHTNEEGEQVLRMYWLDAYEDHYKQPGVVYLFGKVWIEAAKAHVSCCVTVKNIERKMYLLPRKMRVNKRTGQETGAEVTFIDVYQEFNDVIADKYRIMKFKSMKVVKAYAFEKAEIPVESEYLELRYSAEHPPLPGDLSGETFSHVFGSNTSALELLLLDRKMKGPSWIDIKMPQIPNPSVSWCKVEAFVSRPEHLTVIQTMLTSPPLVVMTLNLRTLPNPKTHQNEVIAASCLLHHQFQVDKPTPKPLFQQHFCAVSKPNDCIFPFDFKDRVQEKGNSMNVEIMPTERALLGFLLAKIHKMDPDIVVGHDVFGFDLDVLLHRITQNKIPHWSRLGRLKRATMPKLSNAPGAKNSGVALATSGRLVSDVMISAKELIRCRSYDLTELTSQILKDKRHEVDVNQIRTLYNNSQHLLQLIEWTLIDSTYILRIMYELMIIPLALQITNICGNVMARTLMGGRAERNEYLLLHAFTEKNFIVPDKSYGKKTQVAATEGDEGADETVSKKKGARRKPAYAGGLVLEPKKGFYDKYILLLDFNSLYPSIIQEYNICFTTISRSPNDARTDPREETEEEDVNPDLPEPDLEPGVLPTEIRKLVQSRRQVKQLMKASDLSQELYSQYDIRQKALKLTANSMYGCLGFSHSRFYAKSLASLVTGKGREILMKTKDLVQNMNLDVIYGDTDSIMVNTNSTDIDVVFKLGNKIKTEVNKLYRLLEIDIDGVFKSMLLLKKKKYAALSVQKVGDKYTTTQELKGLDIVRRDWCQLAKEAGNYVVTQILSGESRESILENIHSKLIDVGQQVQDDKIPVELYHITKQLTKNTEDYPDKKSLPHVQVALRMNSKGGKRLKAGDIVYYVICEDGSSLSASQRAYHPEELAKREDLKIDTKYYLAHQVHPVVCRLCDPIDGTDSARIAECLGLDPSGYRQAMQHHRGDDEDEALLGGAEMSDEEKYKDCDRFKFSCPQCNRETIIDDVFTGTGSVVQCSLEKCPNPECNSKPADHVASIQNRMTCVIRNHVKVYYEGWLRCEDTACGTRTRRLPLAFYRGHPVCPACQRGVLHPEYSDSQLYTQLCFYQHVFDLDRALTSIKEIVDRTHAKECSKGYKAPYQSIKTHVDKHIKHSAYSQVQLSRLFQGLFVLK